MLAIATAYAPHGVKQRSESKVLGSEPGGQRPAQYVSIAKTCGSFIVMTECTARSSGSSAPIAPSTARAKVSKWRTELLFVQPPTAPSHGGSEWWKSVSITRMPRSWHMSMISR